MMFWRLAGAGGVAGAESTQPPVTCDSSAKPAQRIGIVFGALILNITSQKLEFKASPV